MFKSRLAPMVALALLAASSAQAAVVRAWVSGKGSDVAGCGAPTNACRTLQYTFTSIVSAGGEIDILDPAGYGTLTITHAISIVNDGVGTAGVQAASNGAITINAGAGDAVRLKGLDVEGLGTATNGIQFNSGASLVVEDCTVKDFAGVQLSFEPTAASELFVSNSRFEHGGSGSDGIFIAPQNANGVSAIRATLNRVEVVSNAVGISVDASNFVTPSGRLNIAITDSAVAANHIGISASGLGAGAITPAVANVVVRSTTVSDNGNGIAVFGAATVHLGHSTLTGNDQGFTTSSGGHVDSYGDNMFSDGSDATPTAEGYK
jgi:hypothetical protein